MLNQKTFHIRLIYSGASLLIFAFVFSVLGTQAKAKQTANLIAEGKQIFRFDTFGDEDFWGGQLQLHQATQGEKFGGVGPGVSLATALSVGLKVDVQALLERL